MSKRNGDRARFQKERTRKLLRRQRIKALLTRTLEKAGKDPATLAGSRAMADEGGMTRAGD